MQAKDQHIMKKGRRSHSTALDIKGMIPLEIYAHTTHFPSFWKGGVGIGGVVFRLRLGYVDMNLRSMVHLFLLVFFLVREHFVSGERDLGRTKFDPDKISKQFVAICVCLL